MGIHGTFMQRLKRMWGRFERIICITRKRRMFPIITGYWWGEGAHGNFYRKDVVLFLSCNIRLWYVELKLSRQIIDPFLTSQFNWDLILKY